MFLEGHRHDVAPCWQTHICRRVYAHDTYSLSYVMIDRMWRCRALWCVSELGCAAVAGLEFLSPFFSGLLEHPPPPPLCSVDVASKVLGEDNLASVRFL